eukprot:scaffold47767_cov38-Phaeocystis_antarctica.AAC.1
MADGATAADKALARVFSGAAAPLDVWIAMTWCTGERQMTSVSSAPSSRPASPDPSPLTWSGGRLRAQHGPDLVSCSPTYYLLLTNLALCHTGNCRGGGHCKEGCEDSWHCMS